VLWKLDAGKRRLRGIGDDGAYTAVSLGDAKGTEPSKFVIVKRDGQIAHSYELRSPLGIPAVMEGVAFVPWDSQYVTALDAETGDELGRILLRHQVSNARQIGGDLYFGQLGLTKFDDKIGAAQRNAGSYVSLPTKKVPGEPEWYKDGTLVYRPSDSASTKIHLWARPSNTEGGPGIIGNTYVASYFSVVLGLDAKDGALRWTHVLEKDIVGGAATRDGFALCDAEGKLWGVSSQGSAPAEVTDLGKPLVACVVQADKLGTIAPTSASLAEQIEHVLGTHRPSLATAYAFLVEELPHVDDPLVTKILIDLIEHPRTVPSLAKRAAVLLAEQRTGVEHMLAALKRHYDFLSGHRPPPVGALAQALEALKDERAAEPLAKHLNDFSTSAQDVAHIADALYALGTSSEADELKTFFALYRATADQPPLVRAVVRVAQTLVRVGGPSGQAMVEFAATDPLTHPAVRSKLAELIHPKRLPKPPKPEPSGQLSEARN
jgi:outer membrane protein assembly factor BamB